MAAETDVKTIEELAPRYVAGIAVTYWESPGRVTVTMQFKNGQGVKSFSSFGEAIAGIASMPENQRSRDDGDRA